MNIPAFILLLLKVWEWLRGKSPEEKLGIVEAENKELKTELQQVESSHEIETKVDNLTDSSVHEQLQSDWRK